MEGPYITVEEFIRTPTRELFEKLGVYRNQMTNTRILRARAGVPGYIKPEDVERFRECMDEVVKAMKSVGD